MAELYPIYFCFIDYAKTFDYVDQNKLWQILKEMEIADYHICLQRNLYANQEATEPNMAQPTGSQLGKKYINTFMCLTTYLTPYLFNFYVEYIMQHDGLDDSQAEIKIARRNINSLR